MTKSAILLNQVKSDIRDLKEDIEVGVITSEEEKWQRGMAIVGKISEGLKILGNYGEEVINSLKYPDSWTPISKEVE